MSPANIALENAETILRFLAEPVLILDESLGTVLANEAFCELLQISPDFLEGKLLNELLNTINDRALYTILKTVVEYNGNLDYMEIECTVPPGIEKTLTVNSRLMSVNDGRSKIVLVELRDMTNEKISTMRLQELNDALFAHGSALERINSDLESFNRWVSHDLRTPLRFTNTIASRLMENHRDTLTEDAKTSIQMILDTTHEMGGLIENLLSFVQVDRVPIQKRRVNALRLVREALADLRESYKGRHLEIRVDELPQCRADRTLLKQVFLNLLANALRFTLPRDYGEIHVGFEMKENTTVYFIRDNGVGFHMNVAQSIFTAAHRVNTDPHLQGTGIGLTLVKRIIDRHGGRIWAEGEPSRGATFYFQIEGGSNVKEWRPMKGKDYQ